MKRFTSQCVALTAALVWMFSVCVQDASAQSTRTPWQHLTQAQLTAVWWQWALGIPISNSPFFDSTGANAYTAQPYSDLLFLTGTVTIQELANGDVIGQATRSIQLKQGTALFFPAAQQLV